MAVFFCEFILNLLFQTNGQIVLFSTSLCFLHRLDELLMLRLLVVFFSYHCPNASIYPSVCVESGTEFQWQLSWHWQRSLNFDIVLCFWWIFIHAVEGDFTIESTDCNDGLYIQFLIIQMPICEFYKPTCTTRNGGLREKGGRTE